MSIQRILKILLKDLRLGPRSPIFMYALIFPAAITLVVQVVFGSLFERLANVAAIGPSGGAERARLAVSWVPPTSSRTPTRNAPSSPVSSTRLPLVSK